MFKKLFIIGSILVICFNIWSIVNQNHDLFFSHTYWQRFPSLQQVFLSSQYVNKHPKGWIPDETAFSYAGGMYMKGTNPVLVVPDAPPLGKYFIGISIAVFNNENDIILLSAIASLVLLFFLGKQVLRNTTLALIPPLLFSFEPIFKNQLIYTPLLDIFQLVFLLASFYVFNKALTQKQAWVDILLSGILIGCFMATKFWVSGITIMVSWMITLFLLKKWKLFLPAIAASLIALSIVPLSYIRVFAFGYTLRSFFGIQKWVFLYHQSNLILPFSVWPLLLLNRWYVWFGSKPVISDSQWSITWPLLTLIGVCTILGMIFRKISVQKEVILLVVWPLIYLLFFSVGQIFSRYFLILIPVLYLVSVYALQQVYTILVRKR